VVSLGGRKLGRRITGESSYLSSHDQRLIFGLGHNAPPKVNAEIHWPSGQVQTGSGLPIERWHKVVEPL